jgi:hypothetical protein
MRYRDISEEKARGVLKILVEECGFRVLDPRDADGFVRTIQAPQPQGRHVCTEYRFIGALGFGGKFRNNGNHNNTPYVDCYSEHETPARLQMIERADKQLAELFDAALKENVGNG